MEPHEESEFTPASKALKESIESQGIKEGDQITIYMRGVHYHGDATVLADQYEDEYKVIFLGTELADDGKLVLKVQFPPELPNAGEVSEFTAESFDEFSVTAGWGKE